MLVVDRENRATELYDLATDPGQQRNRVADSGQAKRVAEMRARFLQFNDHVDATHEPRTTAVIGASRGKRK